MEASSEFRIRREYRVTCIEYEGRKCCFNCEALTYTQEDKFEDGDYYCEAFKTDIEDWDWPLRCDKCVQAEKDSK
jgi:hypothetical protein